MSIRDGFAEVVDAAGDVSPALVALGQAVAGELDRQSESGDGVNAALVAQFVGIVETLAGSVAEVTAADDMLAKLRNSKASRAS